LRIQLFTNLMAKIIIRSILACVMIALTICYIINLAVMIRASFVYGTGARLFFFALGALFFTGLWLFTWERTAFLRTSIHERAHALIFAIFGHSVREMYISADYSGHGHVTTHGPTSGIAITLGTLAPYCLPYIVALVLVIYPLIKPELYRVYFFMLGAPVSLHIMISVSDYFRALLGSHDSDIHKVGATFATISIMFVNLIIYGSVISMVMGGFSWTKAFLLSGLKLAWMLLDIL